MAEKKEYTAAQKKKVLNDAEKLGIHAAAKKHEVPWQTVTKWVKEAGITPATPEKKAPAKNPAEKADKAKASAGKAPRTKKNAESAEDKIADAPKATAAPAEKKTSRTQKPAAKKPATGKNAKSKSKLAAEEKKVVEDTAAKVAARKSAKKSANAVIIQSAFGHEIKPEDVLVKVGDVDAVYIRVDQNRAYWVRGEETGSVELW